MLTRNVSGSKIGPDRASVHTGPAIRTAFWSGFGQIWGPAKKKVQFWNSSGPRLDRRTV